MAPVRMAWRRVAPDAPSVYATLSQSRGGGPASGFRRARTVNVGRRGSRPNDLGPSPTSPARTPMVYPVSIRDRWGSDAWPLGTDRLGDQPLVLG
jgi:hypothetical protein